MAVLSLQKMEQLVQRQPTYPLVQYYCTVHVDYMIIYLDSEKAFGTINILFRLKIKNSTVRNYFMLS